MVSFFESNPSLQYLKESALQIIDKNIAWVTQRLPEIENFLLVCLL